MLTFPLEGYDFIHVSPPCQRWSRMVNCRPGLRERVPGPGLLPCGRGWRTAASPIVMENIKGSPAAGSCLAVQFLLRPPAVPAPRLGRRERLHRPAARASGARHPGQQGRPLGAGHGHVYCRAYCPGRHGARAYGRGLVCAARAAGGGCAGLHDRLRGLSRHGGRLAAAGRITGMADSLDHGKVILGAILAGPPGSAGRRAAAPVPGAFHRHGAGRAVHLLRAVRRSGGRGAAPGRAGGHLPLCRAGHGAQVRGVLRSADRGKHTDEEFRWSCQQLRELYAERRTGEVITASMEVLTRGTVEDGKRGDPRPRRRPRVPAVRAGGIEQELSARLPRKATCAPKAGRSRRITPAASCSALRGRGVHRY